MSTKDAEGRECVVKEAVVLRVEGAKALLGFESKSECEGCGAPCMLSGEKKKQTIWIDNQSYEKGEKVEIRVSPRDVVAGAFFLYGLPCIMLIVFSIVGNYLASFWSEGYQDVGAIVGTLVSLPVIAIYLRLLSRDADGLRVLSVSRVRR